MICDFGDVVVVPFPFVDRPIAKRRPAVVLSAEDFNRDNDQSILLMITTAAASHWPSDIRISDGVEAGLSHQSVVRWKAFTLPNLAILRRIGQLGERDKELVRRTARRSLAPAS